MNPFERDTFGKKNVSQFAQVLYVAVLGHRVVMTHPLCHFIAKKVVQEGLSHSHVSHFLDIRLRESHLPRVDLFRC